MTGYLQESRVMVRPFSHRREGDTVVIGDLDRDVYLTIPAEGLDILESLAAGHTVGETVRRYQDRHGETPDIEDFLEALESEGFVGAGPTGPPAKPRRTWELPWLTQAMAQRFFGPPVLVTSLALIAFGIVLGVVDFPTIPPPDSVLFLKNSDHFAELTWATYLIGFAGVALHEIAHLLAARAVGVPARIGFGNQMYIIVAQTTMDGIWLAPKGRRYVAFLAGSILDGVCGSILIIVQWADHQGWISIPPIVTALIRAVLFTYILRLTYQTFLFLRTDFYYVVANALNCRNLLADAEDHLRNLVARVRRRPEPVDQSGIPRRELRAVRFYSVVWVLGRVAALAALFFLILPVLWGYLVEVLRLVTGHDTRLGVAGFLTIFLLAMIFQGGGIYLWLRGLLRSRRQRSGHRVNAATGTGSA